MKIDYINALREYCRCKLANEEDISEFNYQFLTFGEHYRAFCNEIININTLQKINPDNLKVIGFEVNEERCTYCSGCVNVCPANSFIFERKFKDSTEGI